MSDLAAPVTILTSGVGLGTYVPALLNQQALLSEGLAADVEVIEGNFTGEDIERHLAHKAAYHHDFRLAAMGNRMTRDVRGSLDPVRIDALLERWVAEKRSRFIVWSGFWFSVLQRYLARMPQLHVEVDLCRIDATVSASFRIQPSLIGADCRDVWLWRWDTRTLDWQVPMTAAPPVDLEMRPARLVVHGGGWALGGFLDVVPELGAAGWDLDVLAPEPAEWDGRDATDRRFTPAPGWHPWHRTSEGGLMFPPVDEIDADGARRPLPDLGHPPAHDLVRNAHAIVSKPGGGTLIDSLAAATPVVLLEPYSDSEARNGALWKHLGLGIGIERWRATGFDPEVLAELQGNLLAARCTGRTYPLERLVA